MKRPLQQFEAAARVLHPWLRSDMWIAECKSGPWIGPHLDCGEDGPYRWQPVPAQYHHTADMCNYRSVRHCMT
jgi:hypothetical protein